MANIDETIGRDIAHKSDLRKAANGDLDTILGRENLKEAIFRRIITQKGTVVHRPNYGVGIAKWQNAPFTIDTQKKIAQEIKNQLIEDPRIKEVTSIFFNYSDTEPEKTIIMIKVEIEGFGEEQVNIIPFGA